MNPYAIELNENDEDIKALLVKHGKQTHLIPPPEFTGAFRNHVTWADEEYAYTVTHFHGFPLPADNGYRAIRVPLNAGTTREIAEVVRAFIEDGMDKDGPYYAEERKDMVEAN